MLVPSKGRHADGHCRGSAVACLLAPGPQSLTLPLPPPTRPPHPGIESLLGSNFEFSDRGLRSVHVRSSSRSSPRSPARPPLNPTDILRRVHRLPWERRLFLLRGWTRKHWQISSNPSVSARPRRVCVRVSFPAETPNSPLPRTAAGGSQYCRNGGKSFTGKISREERVASKLGERVARACFHFVRRVPEYGGIGRPELHLNCSCLACS